MNSYKRFVQTIERFFWNLYSHIWDNYLEFPDFRKNINNIVNCLLKYKQNENEKILDVGCGTGNYTIELAKKGFQVLGIDFSPNMMKRAKEKVQDLSKNSIEFFQMDLNELSYFQDNEFDHVLSVHTFQNANNPQQFLREIKRILKPNGYFLVLIKDKVDRKRRKTKLKLSFLKILLNILKTILGKIRKKTKLTKIELQALLYSSDYRFIEECPYSGAIAILVQNIKN